MGKETFVETSGFQVDLPTDKEAGSCRPKNLGRRVVLPFIVFDREEDTSPAVGIAVFVEKSTCRTGIFKRFFVSVSK